MKKTFRAVALLGLCLLLTACQSGEESERPQFKEYVVPEITEEQTLPQDSGAAQEEYVPARAKNTEASGTLSDGVAFEFYADGELALSGKPLTAVLKDENQLGERVSKIKKITFGEGVTGIGKNACASLPALETVAFSGAVSRIGEMAFSGDRKSVV